MVKLFFRESVHLLLSEYIFMHSSSKMLFLLEEGRTIYFIKRHKDLHYAANRVGGKYKQLEF